MSIILRKAEKTTTLADLQDRLRQVEEAGDLLVSVTTKTLDDGTDVNVAAFREKAAIPPIGKLELIEEPADLSQKQETAFLKKVQANGSDLISMANLFIEGTQTHVLVCRQRYESERESEPSEDGHGSSNPYFKPPVNTTFRSPNHSSRNGVKVDTIVLHCTEASLESTIKTFMNAEPLPKGRQVSVHYVIDKGGDIYQMVSDDLRANHCKGVNERSIGIEHVARDTDAIAPAQEASSVALLQWLMQQYDVSPERIFGHDFTPGRLTETSCPDKLFGSHHSQSTIKSWIESKVAIPA